MLFDTHIHLDLLTDIRQEIEAANDYGVRQFLLPAVRPATWDRLYTTAESLPGVYVAPGIHPLAAREWTEFSARLLWNHLQKPATIALGEIGLDRLVDTPHDQQETTLRAQLRIAIEADLPVILHCRKATGRLLEILCQEKADRVGGILHGFTGSLETAHAAIRLGFALGIGGAATWPEAERVAAVITKIPEEWLVLETDAPDQSPHPHRSETNRPAWMQYIHQRLAALRDWSPDETATLTTNNARRVLRLHEKEKRQ